MRSALPALLIALLLGAFCGIARAQQPPAVYPQLGQAGWVNAVAVSPDGKLLASGSGFVPTVVLWDVESGRQVRILALRADVEDIAFSPDGQTLAISTLDGELSLWAPRAGGALRSFEAGLGNANAIVFSPDGTTVATGGDDGVIRLWDVAGLQPMRPVDTKAGVLSSLAFAGDGRSLVFAAGDSVAVWDLASGTAVHSPGEQQQSVAYSPDGKSVLIGTGWGAVQLWDPQAGPQRRSLIDPALPPDTAPEGFSTANAFYTNLPSVAFSPKGDLVAVSSESGDQGLEHAYRRYCASLVKGPERPLHPGLLGRRQAASRWRLRGRKGVGYSERPSRKHCSPDTPGSCSSLHSQPTAEPSLRTSQDSVALWDATSGRTLRTLAGSDTFMGLRSVAGRQAARRRRACEQCRRVGRGELEVASAPSPRRILTVYQFG